MKRPVIFATEAELCTAFMEWARKEGWTPYPETAGWDIVLVHPDGTQIGVQAKLTFNMKVLAQAVESGWGWNTDGPDFRAVLVPHGCGHSAITTALGLMLFQPDRHDKASRFTPELSGRGYSYERWHYCSPEKRCELPRFVPDVIAGGSAPVQLTKWKIAALEIAVLLELKGSVIRADFQRAGIDHRRWAQQWLLPAPNHQGGWVAGPDMPNFRAQHPTVYEQVKAEVVERLGALAAAT